MLPAQHDQTILLSRQYTEFPRWKKTVTDSGFNKTPLMWDQNFIFTSRHSSTRGTEGDDLSAQDISQRINCDEEGLHTARFHLLPWGLKRTSASVKEVAGAGILIGQCVY